MELYRRLRSNVVDYQWVIVKMKWGNGFFLAFFIPLYAYARLVVWIANRGK